MTNGHTLGEAFPIEWTVRCRQADLPIVSRHQSITVTEIQKPVPDVVQGISDFLHPLYASSRRGGAGSASESVCLARAAADS